MKNKLKTTLMILAIVVLCLSVGVYAGYVMSAADVSYTKPDGQTVSVKSVLDELHANESENHMEKAVGDEVTVGGEQFYVLECDKYSREATLIAKYNLNGEGTAQQNSQVMNFFSSTNYWSSSFTSSPFNVNDISGYQSTDVIGKAKRYGISKGAKSSRLLTYEEACELKTNANAYYALWGPSDRATYSCYWLGSAYSSTYVWAVFCHDQYITAVNYRSTSTYYGVRPVIKVWKNSIS